MYHKNVCLYRNQHGAVELLLYFTKHEIHIKIATTDSHKKESLRKCTRMRITMQHFHVMFFCVKRMSWMKNSLLQYINVLHDTVNRMNEYSVLLDKRPVLEHLNHGSVERRVFFGVQQRSDLLESASRCSRANKSCANSTLWYIGVDSGFAAHSMMKTLIQSDVLIMGKSSSE